MAPLRGSCSLPGLRVLLHGFRVAQRRGMRAARLLQQGSRGGRQWHRCRLGNNSRAALLPTAPCLQQGIRTVRVEAEALLARGGVGCRSNGGVRCRLWRGGQLQVSGAAGRVVVRVAAPDLFCLVPEQGGMLPQLLILLGHPLLRLPTPPELPQPQQGCRGAVATQRWHQLTQV